MYRVGVDLLAASHVPKAGTRAIGCSSDNPVRGISEGYNRPGSPTGREGSADPLHTYVLVLF